MGLTYADVEIRDLDQKHPAFSGRFLVDTGAVECVVNADDLRDAGVMPEGRKQYELADGSLREMDYGFARIKVRGAETVSEVVFAPAKSEPILGVVVMELLGLVVDPRTNTLKKLAAVSLK
ncbi:MAG: retroviral-like aspartic protease family protein [Planctomycetota bacterium]